jgi:hypothetical protein
MKIPKRDYHFKSSETSSENRMFWIMTIIGLAIAFALYYFLG